MENIGNIILGIMIPFAGTTLGAACVYFMKKGIRQNVEKVFWALRPVSWWRHPCGHF